MKRKNLWRGLTGVSFSLVVLSALGYGIANTFRTQVDSALGTRSYETNTTNPKYVSDYKTGEEMMQAAKNIAVREGEEGTVIMKNDNKVFPLGKKVALFGNAAYKPYRGMNQAGNSDAVDLVKAFENAGVTLDPTVKAIYDKAFSHTIETEVEQWGHKKKVITCPFYPNEAAGDNTADGYQVNEIPVSKFTDGKVGGAASNWEDTVKANDNVGVVVFMRPGGEGTNYLPGVQRDSTGAATNQNPLALTSEELGVVDAAKRTCSKVVVLLNTSCTIEVAPLMSGDHAVDGIAYIGLPNDYQFTGIVNVLEGKANATGALADTYAYNTAVNPAMQNFGGDYFTDYQQYVPTAVGEDPRYPSEAIGSDATGSFGGGHTYNGGMYIVEAESIYTGYKYYETRYFDAVLNQGNAKADVGISYPGDKQWTYDHEVCYPFGYGLSYLSYTEKLTGVTVDKSVKGNIVATIEIKNTSDKDGLFLGQLYVNTPYTQYDKDNLVEKAAINFLSSGKISLKAGQTGTVKITVPTKYLASYDYKKAKTYILDGGDYYFATGNGSHEAVNNVLKAMGQDVTGDTDKVYRWSNGNESKTDTTTFAKSASGAMITNKVDDADINYWLKDDQKITYLTRNNWEGTYPKNYNAEGNKLSISSSPKKDAWVKELRNQTYMVKTDDPVKNFDGAKNGLKFSDATGDALTDINNDFWDKLVEEIPAEEALGAIAHGGNQSDSLTNVENPIVGQNDGPAGFNGKALSTNNGEKGKDPYYVDKDSEAGKFKAAINSQTLLGSSFNPDVAYEWGKVLGNVGLWIGNYEIWAAALNYHRTAYNGRNVEYPSEDPMLCSVIGGQIIKATREKGIIVGPKHIGFNDQEHNRAGIQVYLNEQKVRETDLRGFQMAVEDEGALGMMLAFNRLGATNVSHNVGLVKGIFREEWDFKGLISTDMMSNSYYFNPESCTMATVTMMADFHANDNHLNQGNGGVDSTWAYLSPNAIKNDNALVEQARQNLKYQLFAFSQSAIMNVTTTRVTPAWEAALVSMIVIFSVLGTAGTVMVVLNGLKGE